LNATGSAAVGIKAAKFRGLPIPFPSLAEQPEIVRRVEQLFTLADQLGARYAKAQAYVDKLTPSLLAKAFRGELVPQDPNDEPAAALLARIRSGANDESKPRRRKATA
jgi:type I restriction enzyme S subunit